MIALPPRRALIALVVLAFVGPAVSSLRGDDPGSADDGWTWRRLVAPKVPAVVHRDWPHNPIDAFVLAGLEGHALTPAPQADRLTLLKRVTFDLTGLLPTRAERDAFLADDAPDAYAKVVDRLLASPHYGERAAQQWFDVVRYSETEGYKFDQTRPEMYRYRDWVIRSLNADLPFDRFAMLQIAGDELEPTNPDARIATGYLRLHPEESNGSNYREIRQDILNDITDNFATTFLGMTAGCARCHDHKFDPISQVEYYRLQAYFAAVFPRDDIVLAGPKEREAYAVKLSAWEAATKSLREQRAALLRPNEKKVFDEYVAALDPETQAALKAPETERSPLQRQLAAYGGKQIVLKLNRIPRRRLDADGRKQVDVLTAKIDAIEKPSPLPVAHTVTDLGPEAPKVFRLSVGDYRKPKAEVQPGVLECLETSPPPIEKLNASTGRRSALARWLCGPDQVMTARVIVNRIWQRHFGAGIVGTPNDFGAMGDRPTHHALLDFLAAELVREHWSLKAIERLIATSATYRQESDPARNPTAALADKCDPGDRLLWHQRSRRRDAESIRDGVLFAAGTLDERMFGPSALPDLPPALQNARSAWTPSDKAADRNRRSVYCYHTRNLMLPLFQAFDAPTRNLSCPARTETSTAPQALVLLNGEFVLAQAQALATELCASPRNDPESLIRKTYFRILCRPPRPEETSAALLFLQTQAHAIAAGPVPHVDAADALSGAVTDLCQALFNSAEFLYVE
jgi:hypothetical protein